MSKLNFECKHLSISDEEFGCEITLSDTSSDTYQYMSEDKIMDYNEKYVLLQRTYPEDNFETDYYYFESSENKISFDLNKIHTIKLNKNRFEISISETRIVIGLNLTDKELADLTSILASRFKDRIRVEGLV